MNTKNYDTVRTLEKKYGVMTLGMFIKAIREADEISQSVFAKKLKISRANLCDIEKGRKIVSPERAAKIAKILKHSEYVLIQLTLQDMLRSANLKYDVRLSEAS
jgi:transcriptional regulator with XRE-family HTH domain